MKAMALVGVSAGCENLAGNGSSLTLGHTHKGHKENALKVN